MSQENVEIVQRALAAYMNEDEATLRALIADDNGDLGKARPTRPARAPLRGLPAIVGRMA